MNRLRIAALLIFTACGAASAQEKKNAAPQLKFFGHSFFVLSTAAGTKVAFDPHAISEYGAPPMAPDIVVMTHMHDDHNRKEVFTNADSKDLKAFNGLTLKGKTFDWAKIDEKVKDIRVRSVPTYHDNEDGAKRGKNSIMIVEADGLVYCHLGDLGHELTEEQVKAVGPVDVLMIPVGGIYTINGEVAKKVVEQLKPKMYIFPMHYGTKVYQDLPGPDEFLDGQKNVNRLDTTNTFDIVPLPKDGKTKIIMLGWSSAK